MAVRVYGEQKQRRPAADPETAWQLELEAHEVREDRCHRGADAELGPAGRDAGIPGAPRRGELFPDFPALLGQARRTKALAADLAQSLLATGRRRSAACMGLFAAADLQLCDTLFTSHSV